jgi:hypothetical protein
VKSTGVCPIKFLLSKENRQITHNSMFADDHFEFAPCEANSKPSCQRSTSPSGTKQDPTQTRILTSVGSIRARGEQPRLCGTAYLRATKLWSPPILSNGNRQIAANLKPDLSERSESNGSNGIRQFSHRIPLEILDFDF